MQLNPKIYGSFVIGFALISGSYILTNFGKSQSLPIEATVSTRNVLASTQNYIAESDNNSDGIEDWREEFVNKAPLEVDATTTGPVQYKTPDTLTDQVGIQLFQAVMESKNRGNIGPDKAKVIADTAATLRESAANDYIYKASNIQIIASSPDTIRTYANTMAQIIINNNIPGSQSELTIINEALRAEDHTKLDRLDPIIAMYKKLRDQTLMTPVPVGFEKQHLDLVNVYNAIYSSLTGIKLAFSDPVVALLRIKRYQDDASGLRNALTNMYNKLVPYDNLFTENDPAILFVSFGPKI